MFLTCLNVTSHLKVLEAEDVENPDGFKVVFAFYLLINSHDDPREALGVQRHGNRIPGIYGLSMRMEKEFLITPY